MISRAKFFVGVDYLSVSKLKIPLKCSWYAYTNGDTASKNKEAEGSVMWTD